MGTTVRLKAQHAYHRQIDIRGEAPETWHLVCAAQGNLRILALMARYITHLCDDLLLLFGVCWCRTWMWLDTLDYLLLSDVWLLHRRQLSKKPFLLFHSLSLRTLPIYYIKGLSREVTAEENFHVFHVVWRCKILRFTNIHCERKEEKKKERKVWMCSERRKG